MGGSDKWNDHGTVVMKGVDEDVLKPVFSGCGDGVCAVVKRQCHHCCIRSFWLCKYKYKIYI